MRVPASFVLSVLAKALVKVRGAVLRVYCGDSCEGSCSGLLNDFASSDIEERLVEFEFGSGWPEDVTRFIRDVNPSQSCPICNFDMQEKVKTT